MTGISSSLSLEDLKPEHVLVVGVDVGVGGVVSINWSDLGTVNIKDFHLVILCIEAAYTAETSNAEMHGYGNAVQPRVINEFLEAPNKEIVFIGLRLPDGWPLPVYRQIPFLQPVRPDAGTNITNVEDEFGSYMSRVSSYSWSVAQGVREQQKNSAVKADYLAMAAGTDAIGAVYRKGVSTRVVLLPSPTDCDLDEGVAILLADRYEVGGGPLPRPDWLDEVELPRVTEARTRHSSAQDSLRDAVETMHTVDADLEEAEADLGLLFEQGEVLEDHVWRVLGELGAEVTPPENRRSGHDGTLTTPLESTCVLEVKGKKNQIGQGDLRELQQWVDDMNFGDDVSEGEPTEVTGLFVGNPHRERPLSDRPAPFADNAVKFAKKRDLVLVTTEQLVDALRVLDKGEFDPEGWWTRLTNSSGPVEFD